MTRAEVAVYSGFHVKVVPTVSELIRDPLWQFIGVIVAIATIGIGIFFGIRNQLRKSLSYEIVSCTPVMSIKQELKEKLQILYDGKPIKQAHVCVVKFINSGNVSIVPTDYFEKLSINFGEKAQVLTSEIINQNPQNLDVSVAVERNRVVLSASMLNRTDSFSVKTVVSDYEHATLGGRITGIVKIKDLGESRFMSFWYPLLVLTGLVFYFVGFAGLASLGASSSYYSSVFAAMLLGSLAIEIPLAAWAGFKIGRFVLQKIRKSEEARAK